MSKRKMTTSTTIPQELIEHRICLLRGQRVMVDHDLADLYGVATKRLNEQVSRNIERFPGDFMFLLTPQEDATLRSQNATSNARRGGRRSLPRAFTEHGILMLSSVLRSERAVQVNIAIMRAFVHLRQLMANHEELSRKLTDMERKYDSQFRVVFDAIRELMKPDSKSKGSIGFGPGED